MKKIALFLLYAICTQDMVYCQQNNLQVKYGRLQNQNYIVNSYLQLNVVSDYGMRVARGRASRFHRGIDYVPNNYTVGDAIVSISNGTILRIVAPNSTAKYIVIEIDGTNDCFAYLHMFDDGALPMSRGQFRIQYLPSSNNSLPVIIDLINETAFASIPDISFTFNNNNYITTNRVVMDQVIAPIGTSGGVGAHVHISLLEQNVSPSDQNYSIDAWNLIAHNPTVLETRIRSRRVINDDYHITECEANHIEPGFQITQHTWGTFVPNYTDNTRNIVQVEVSMQNAQGVQGDPDRYTNVAFTEDEIDILLKKHNGSSGFANIKGSEHVSKFVIDPEGSVQTYPERMRNGEYGGFGIGASGCMPFAYRTEGDGGFIGRGIIHPHDYYVSPDFYLRIDKSHQFKKALKLANYPWDCRYEDDTYSIKSQVRDIHGHLHSPSPEINFSIDNFKPFVHGVQVYLYDQALSASSKEIAYSRFWEANPTVSSQIRLGGRSDWGLNNPLTNRKVVVYALASESMPALQARIPELNTSWTYGVAEDVEKKKWQFTFGPYNLMDDHCYKLEFRGNDLNGNQILDLPQPIHCSKEGENKKAIVPKRNGANSWDNAHVQGDDKVHDFYIGPCEERPEAVSESPCPEREMIQYAILHARNAWSGTGRITLNISVDYSNWVFTWKNEQGNVIGTIVQT